MSSKKERAETTAAEKQAAKDHKAKKDPSSLQEQYSPDPISEDIEELQRGQTHEEK